MLSVVARLFGTAGLEKFRAELRGQRTRARQARATSGPAQQALIPESPP